ncbi:hypothetical protein [Streptomyces acidiscabies]|uniref:hypothetical protein n=1 Tax=Streptomyces acidiscabies TaxID=42234 RepID=UPI00095151DF|nr:hypothetical protein [Streptomyces acidiscabies]
MERTHQHHPQPSPTPDRAFARTVRMQHLRHNIARRALDASRTPTDAVILRVHRTRTILTIATRHPGARYTEYNVDSYRLTTPHERADDIEDGYAPVEWLLIVEHGDDGPDRIPGMFDEALAYAATYNLPAGTR